MELDNTSAHCITGYGISVTILISNMWVNVIRFERLISIANMRVKWYTTYIIDNKISHVQSTLHSILCKRSADLSLSSNQLSAVYALRTPRDFHNCHYTARKITRTNKNKIRMNELVKIINNNIVEVKTEQHFWRFSWSIFHEYKMRIVVLFSAVIFWV